MTEQRGPEGPSHPAVLERESFIRFYKNMYTAILLVFCGASAWMYFAWAQLPPTRERGFLLQIATIPSVVFAGYFGYLVFSKWIEDYDTKNRFNLQALGVQESEIPSIQPLKLLLRVAALVSLIIAVGLILLQLK